MWDNHCFFYIWRAFYFHNIIWWPHAIKLCSTSTLLFCNCRTLELNYLVDYFTYILYIIYKTYAFLEKNTWFLSKYRLAWASYSRNVLTFTNDWYTRACQNSRTQCKDHCIKLLLVKGLSIMEELHSGTIWTLSTKSETFTKLWKTTCMTRSMLEQI